MGDRVMISYGADRRPKRLYDFRCKLFIIIKLRRVQTLVLAKCYYQVGGRGEAKVRTGHIPDSLNLGHAVTFHFVLHG